MRSWVGDLLRGGTHRGGRWVKVSYGKEGEGVAVVAGREVGGAVVRNRVRRRVREAWRRVGGRGRVRGRVVIRVKRGAEKADCEALGRDLEGVLREIEGGALGACWGSS